jgi:hypothetical protein
MAHVPMSNVVQDIWGAFFSSKTLYLFKKKPKQNVHSSTEQNRFHGNHVSCSNKYMSHYPFNVMLEPTETKLGLQLLGYTMLEQLLHRPRLW